MLTEIDICNTALAHINSKQIHSFDDRTAEATKCRLFYTQTRDTLLREFPWQFASMKVELNPVDYIYSGWDYVYAYPANAHAVRNVHNSRTQRGRKERYKEITDSRFKLIVTDFANAYADITLKIVDTNLFDVQFTEALCFKLASNLVSSLAVDLKLEQIMLQKYMYILQQAKISTINEDQDRRNDFVSKYITARR